MNILPRTCDCGKPGERNDGGGWTCQRCADLTSESNGFLERLIKSNRSDFNAGEVQDRKLLTAAKWRHNNRDSIRARQNAKYKSTGRKRFGGALELRKAA